MSEVVDRQAELEAKMERLEAALERNTKATALLTKLYADLAEKIKGIATLKNFAQGLGSLLTPPRARR